MACRAKKEARKAQQKWENHLNTLTPTEREQAIAEKLRHDYIVEATDLLDCCLFHEQYDFMYDSTLDKGMRKAGKNPMSDEYTEKVNRKRAHFGLQPLSQSGLPEDGSYHVCKQLIETHFESIDKPVKDLVSRVREGVARYK